jgi:hypothetical protein
VYILGPLTGGIFAALFTRYVALKEPTSVKKLKVETERLDTVGNAKDLLDRIETLANERDDRPVNNINMTKEVKDSGSTSGIFVNHFD